MKVTIKGISQKESSTEKETLFGTMERSIMGSGSKEKSTGQECGLLLREIYILGSGKKEWFQDMESMLSRMGNDMRANF